jgi:hypothetical protein
MRTTISGLQLYSLLDSEFKELKSKNCKTCRMPLPFYRDPPDDVSANWSVATPTSCPGGCHLVIAELVTRMWTRYDLEPERPQ